MQIICPNCRSVYVVNQQALPAPKFNAHQKAFGWKFECGHCDTHWWVTLHYANDANHRSSLPISQAVNKRQSLKQLRYPSFQDLFTPANADESHTTFKRPILSNYQQNLSTQFNASVFPSRQSPIAAHEAGFGLSIAPNAEPLSSLPSYKLTKPSTFTRLVRKKSPWKLFIVIFIFGASMLTFEYFYPQKINKSLQQLWTTTQNHSMVKKIEYQWHKWTKKQ